MAWQSMSLSGLHSKTKNRSGYDDLTCGTDTSFGSNTSCSFHGAYSVLADGVTGKYYSGNAFGIEYDDSSNGITELKLRFKVTHSGTNDSSNGYYIGLRGNKYLYKVKPKDTDWTTPIYPTEFRDSTTTLTLTKSYNASSFTLPACALVCTGYPVPYYNSTDARYEIIYDDDDDKTFWYYITHKRMGFATRLESTSAESSNITIGSSRIPLVKQAADNSVGNAITIVDNGDNTATINVPSFVIGAHNSISKDTGTTYNGHYIKIVQHRTSANGGNVVSYRDTFGSADINIAAHVTSISVYAKGVSTYGANVTKKLENVAVNYYTYPTPPTKIWINTGKISYYPGDTKLKSSYKEQGTSTLEENNLLKPKLKDLLMWKWSGATNGTGAAANPYGFRVYVHKIAKKDITDPPSINTETPGNTIDLTGITLYEIENEGKSTEALETYTSTETSKGRTDTYGFYCDIPYVSGESNDAQFGFIPKDLGFSAGDLCYCEVFTYNTWGDGKRRYSKKSATDTKYVPIIGACNIFNGATVWVRVPDPKDSTKLKWAEGTVYVYHDGGWKEAEGVYVRNGGKWKEST